MVAVAVVDVGCCGMMWYDVVWCGVVWCDHSPPYYNADWLRTCWAERRTPEHTGKARAHLAHRENNGEDEPPSPPLPPSPPSPPRLTPGITMLVWLLLATSGTRKHNPTVCSVLAILETSTSHSHHAPQPQILFNVGEQRIERGEEGGRRRWYLYCEVESSHR